MVTKRYPKPSEGQALVRRDAKVDEVAIIYEDDMLLAVNKPARLPMHANLDDSRDHLVAVLTRQLLARDGQAGYLGLHQRLDWGTSGVVIFARHKAANASLARQFEEHTVDKRYLALVYAARWPKGERWQVSVPLGSPRRKGGRVALGGPGALAARTVFRVLTRCGHSALVAARLESGRKHQVRAHLASLGVQLYGDELYGDIKASATVRAERAMLHAYELTLIHPVSGQALHLQAPMPADFTALAAELKLSLPQSISD